MESEGMPSSAIVEQLNDKMWSTRLAGMQSLITSLTELDASARTPLVAEIVISHLDKVAAPEKNLQVLVQVAEAIKTICGTFDLVGRRSATKGLRCVVERLGAKQTKPAAFEALHAVCEACGPTWALSATREAAIGHKNPKILLEALGWAKEAIEAFGMPPLAPTEPVAFAAAAIDHRDAPVREAAMQLLLSVRRAVGPALLSAPQLEKLKDTTRKELVEKSAKLEEAPEAPPPPTRSFKHGAKAQTAAAGSTAAAGRRPLPPPPLPTLRRRCRRLRTRSSPASSSWASFRATL